MMTPGRENERKSSAKRMNASFFKCCLHTEASGRDRLPAEVPFTPNNNSYVTELITTLFSLSWASLLSIIHSRLHVP